MSTRIWFPLQAGAAITLPVFGKPVIFYRSWKPDECLLEHEEVHAGQIRELGTRRYLWGHISQRNAEYGFFRLWSREWMFGRETELEKPGYAAQWKCRERRKAAAAAESEVSA